MKQVWWKENKAAEKFSDSDIIVILSEVLDWLDDNEKVIYMGKVHNHILKEYGLPRTTLSDIINKIHKDNISIGNMWNYITQEIENRVVMDNSQLRPSVQGMVLQNRHNYKDKQEVESKHEFKQMGRIQVNGKDLDINIG